MHRIWEGLGGRCFSLEASVSIAQWPWEAQVLVRAMKGNNQLIAGDARDFDDP